MAKKEVDSLIKFVSVKFLFSISRRNDGFENFLLALFWHFSIESIEADEENKKIVDLKLILYFMLCDEA